ncbi:MAG: hypothetical protein ACI9MB_002947 [Verrucomicrobiales bacterium]|jgi:hypothetical protein
MLGNRTGIATRSDDFPSEENQGARGVSPRPKLHIGRDLPSSFPIYKKRAPPARMAPKYYHLRYKPYGFGTLSIVFSTRLAIL